MELQSGEGVDQLKTRREGKKLKAHAIVPFFPSALLIFEECTILWFKAEKGDKGNGELWGEIMMSSEPNIKTTTTRGGDCLLR